ncbi:cysteine proteinase [Mycena floridula]|nr:cysteine proteinase [Mycena floridula]KAJ7584263.1 cysteine proteinase [Mycena floridula]
MAVALSTMPPPALQPAFLQDDAGVAYHPAKNRESFNKLLPEPVEFVEGSSAGALAVAEGKYEPINASPKAPKNTPSDPRPTKSSSTSVPSTPAKTSSLYSTEIDTSWPPNFRLGAGLFNSGNTCFLNSALQCLLHTPPLLRILNTHTQCSIKGFCMICGLKSVATRAHSKPAAFPPSIITDKLQVIAKHMRRGRQEDSHEFLRYAIDHLQKACLFGQPQKLDPKVQETTWVHKLFGGQLRSRVTCRSCGYNSDTFDRILDLSLDITETSTLQGALKKFVRPDYLKGTDKYKCEKCMKHVNAEKRFSVHEAPLVLTVHFKRFSPLGRKISHAIQYEERLSLQPYMSQGQYGPTYTLYGIICHAGGGPNSGHYYAFVKSKDGHWHEMNDESVSSSSFSNRKSAYMLFYLQNKGQRLESVVRAPPAFTPSTVAASMKKRKAPDAQEEDKGSKVSSPFIGPVLPDSPDAKRRKLSEVDPQADLVKKKIEEANKKSGAMDSLASYGSDDDEQTEKQNVEASLTMPTPESSPVKPPKPEESPSTSIPSISPRVFYPSSRPPKSPSRFNSSPNGPYSRSRMTNVSNTYGKKKTFRPRGF